MRPQLKIYISPLDGCRLRITPLASKTLLSYARLLEDTGSGSGVAVELESLFGGCLWQDAVLVLQHSNLGWYTILDVVHHPTHLADPECEFA